MVFFHLLDCLYAVLLFTFWLQDGNLSGAINFRNTALNSETTLICCVCFAFAAFFMMLTGILNLGGSVELILSQMITGKFQRPIK